MTVLDVISPLEQLTDFWSMELLILTPVLSRTTPTKVTLATVYPIDFILVCSAEVVLVTDGTDTRVPDKFSEAFIVEFLQLFLGR